MYGCKLGYNPEMMKQEGILEGLGSTSTPHSPREMSVAEGASEHFCREGANWQPGPSAPRICSSDVPPRVSLVPPSPPKDLAPAAGMRALLSFFIPAFHGDVLSPSLLLFYGAVV